MVKLRNTIFIGMLGIALASSAVFATNDESTITSLGAGTLDEGDIDTLPARIFRSLTADDVTAIWAANSAQKVDLICSRLMQEADTVTIRWILNQGAICDLNTAISNPDFRLAGGRATLVVELLRVQQSPSSWDSSKWLNVMRLKDGLSSEDITNIPPAILRGLVTNGIFQTERFQTEDQIRALNDALKLAYGNPGSWSATTIGTLVDGGLVETMTLDTLMRLNENGVIPHVNKFKDIHFDDFEKTTALGDRLLNGLGGRNMAYYFTTQHIRDVSQFIFTRPVYLDRVSDAILEENLSNINSYIRRRNQAALLAKRLLRLSIFDDINSISSENISRIANTLPSIGKLILEDLNPASIHGAIPALKEADFLPEDARILTEKMLDNGLIDPSTMTSSDIENMGILMTGLKHNEIREIPGQVLVDSMETLAKQHFKPPQGRVILDVVQTVSTLGQHVLQLGNLMPFLLNSELMNISFTDLNMSCTEGADPINLEVTRSQAYIIMDKATQELGDPRQGKDLYTRHCAVRWGKIMAMGFGSEHAKKIALNTELANIVEELAKYDDYMEESESRVWVAKIDEVFLQNMNLLDAALINQIGCYFKYLNNDRLSQIPRHLIPMVCRKIGESSLRRVPLSEIQRFYAFCMKHVNHQGVMVDLKESLTLLDDADISYLGDLRCGMIKTDVFRLNEGAVVNNLNGMSNCTYDRLTGALLIDVATHRMRNRLLHNTDSMVAAAGQIHHLPKVTMTTLSKEALSDAFIGIAETIVKRRIYEHKRFEFFPTEEPKDERGAELVGFDSTNNLLHIGLISLRATEYETHHIVSRRRKRWAPTKVTVKCSDIMAMGDSANVLTEGDIYSLSFEEFDNCVEAIGSITDQHKLVITQLRLKAKRAWGNDFAHWNLSDLSNCGAIFSGVLPDEIRTFDLSDPNVVYSLSRHNLYSVNQLAAGFDTWLASTGKTAESIVASDILTLGNWICGASPLDIMALNTEIYSETAGTIGQLLCFQSLQLQTLIVHARAIYGDDVTDWCPTTIATIGSALGGIYQGEMGQLSADQLDAILPVTIPAIPLEVIIGLTATQIRGLTTSQASSVSLHQQMSFSDEQIDALLAAGATDLRSSAVSSILALMVVPLVLPTSLIIILGLLITKNKKFREKILGPDSDLDDLEEYPTWRPQFRSTDTLDRSTFELDQAYNESDDYANFVPTVDTRAFQLDQVGLDVPESEYISTAMFTRGFQLDQIDNESNEEDTYFIPTMDPKDYVLDQINSDTSCEGKYHIPTIQSGLFKLDGDADENSLFPKLPGSVC